MRVELASVTRRALLALAAASSLPALAPPAHAADYTIIPSGTVLEKQARLKEVQDKLTALRAKGADQFVDPYLEGESLQLEYDIGQLKKNAAVASDLRRDVLAGKTAFPATVRVQVPDMAEALRFWNRGAGALVLSTRLDANGANVTRVGYGSQSFQKEDGAKFAIELVQSKGPRAPNFDPEGGVVQYVQMALPVFRLSQVMANGGDIISSYGWTELTAPGGLPLRVRIDETRRDPFEFVALRTSDLERTTAHYTALGMTLLEKTSGGKKFKLGGSWGVYQESVDAFEIDREPGTVQMSYVRNGNEETAKQTTGLLLLPPKKRGARLEVGTAQLTMVGTPPTGSAPASPDGLRNEYIGVDEFEKAVGRDQSGMAGSVMDDGFEGMLSRDLPQ